MQDSRHIHTAAGLLVIQKEAWVGPITGLVGFREEIKKFLSPAEVLTPDRTASRQLLDRRHTIIRRLCTKFSGHGDTASVICAALTSCKVESLHFPGYQAPSPPC